MYSKIVPLAYDRLGSQIELSKVSFYGFKIKPCPCRLAIYIGCKAKNLNLSKFSCVKIHRYCRDCSIQIFLIYLGKNAQNSFATVCTMGSICQG